jgi:hypothetical protein
MTAADNFLVQVLPLENGDRLTREEFERAKIQISTRF